MFSISRSANDNLGGAEKKNTKIKLGKMTVAKRADKFCKLLYRTNTKAAREYKLSTTLYVTYFT